MGSLYSDCHTWLHDQPAWVKLAVLAIVGTALFLTSSLPLLATAAAACVALFLSLGQAIHPVRKPVISILVAASLIAAFHAVTGQPAVGIASALRVLSAALLGFALTLTTRPRDLVEVFESLLAPLRRLGVKPEALALQIALMLRYTEHFFVQWRRLDDAHRVRTGKPGGLRLLAPLTLLMLQSAQRVGDALHVRLRK